MDADFSIELGREDPVLDFPWKDPAGEFSYYDLKRHPELLTEIPEAVRFPELGEFLQATNSVRSILQTAKCDAWATHDLTPEEEIYDASHKFASYVDLIFSDPHPRPSSSSQPSLRESFAAHEQCARTLVELVRQHPETSAAIEICVRRSFFEEDGGVEKGAIREGFYFTLYVSGYGNTAAEARQYWGSALKLIEPHLCVYRPPA